MLHKRFHEIFGLSIFTITAVLLVWACAGHQAHRTDRDFDLISTESIPAPDCKPARGTTKIMTVHELVPENLPRTAAARDLRFVIDWMTYPQKDSLLLRMVGYTFRESKNQKQAVPVKMFDADCTISPTGQVLSVKIKTKDTYRPHQAPDPRMIKRTEQFAAGFPRMFIPAFQVKTLTAGDVVASQVEHFNLSVDEDTVVKTEYVYRGLSRRNERMLIVVDYNQKTEVGPYQIIQEGYHLYDAERRYLVMSKGSTRILQDGKPYYRVKLHAETKFSN